MNLHPLFRKVNGRKPKVLLEIRYAYDGLFMLDAQYENTTGRHPIDESNDPGYIYQQALQQVDMLRRAGYDVALDAKHRFFN